MPEHCGHCGREGTLETKDHVTVFERRQVLQQDPKFHDEILHKQIAQIDRCSVCGELTLSRYWWDDQYFDAESVEPELLYPEPWLLDDLPDGVRDRYAEMLKLQHAPAAFAVQAGRVLEAVCADRGIPGDLSTRKQLEQLVEQGEVPKPLVSQAHLVYTYRNYGGHIKEFEVAERDVPLIRGFLDGLLDLLYRGPASLGRVSAALEDRKAEVLDGPTP